MAVTGCTVFATERLLPEAWKKLAQAGPVRAFNPGLLSEGAGWLFAYRLVGNDGLRRIGICRLDSNLTIVDGSQRPLTDGVRFDPTRTYPEMATRWFADPRLYRFGDRLFIYWNSGWHEPHNCQFLQELDPATLGPCGAPRELVLAGERQKLEKNWTFFGDGTREPLRAIYSIMPHRVLEFSLAGSGEIRCEDTARTEWAAENYPRCHGGLRGGTPPVFHADRFWSFCHSVHDAPEGYCYAPAVYCFAPEPPFRPLAAPRVPLKLGNPFGNERTYGRLNPAVSEVIYPCGAARVGDHWLVSHGINDEHAAISRVAASDVLATLEPIAGSEAM